MTKTRKIAQLAVVLLGAGLFLTACGGGSGGGGTPVATTTVSGVASLGPINGGTVNVYALNSSGVKGARIGTATTAADGTYSVNLGSYTGNVLVEVTGGTYKDEATGSTLNNAALTAALTGVSGSVSVAVTPLTDVAAQLAKQGDGSYPGNKIDQANSQVSTMLGVNIINNLPADVTTLNNSASQDNLEYGLMLAAISQMVEDGAATSVADAIGQIKADLADNQLDTTGPLVLTSLNNYLADPTNQSGITSVDQTNLDNAITFIQNNAVTPPPNDSSDLLKAKAMVSDLRNTLLTVHNDSGIGAIGILDTPLAPIVEDLQANFEPEMSVAVENIGLIVATIPQLVDGTTTLPLANGKTLVATLNQAENTFSFTLTASDNTVLGQGTLSATLSTINNEILPTAGSLDATFKTQSGEAIAKLGYAATFATNGSLTAVTLTGSLTTPVLTVDFSQAGRMLTASFAQYPESLYPMDIYPTRIYLAGEVASKLARISGTFDIPSIIYNSYSQETLPTQITIKGEFAALANGVPTGTLLQGTLTGNWTDSTTQNLNAPGYKPLGTVSFEGKIAATARPTIDVLLTVSHISGTTLNLSAKYTRTNPDGSVIFLSAVGTLDDQTDALAVTMTNQAGIQVKLEKTAVTEVSGVILSAGGTELATIDSQGAVPLIRYVDGYFETAI